MRILILGINYAPEQIGIGPYTTELAEALVASGHIVHVVTAKPYYPAWRVWPGYARFGYLRSRAGGVTITHCPHYVPRQPTGLRRIVHQASFALSSMLPMLFEARRFRPDLVLCVAPSLIAAPVSKLAAWLARARRWLHVQDFEVEAAFATGLINGGGLIGRSALWFQNAAMRGFDLYTSISPQMCAKLVELGHPAQHVIEFRNWTDTVKISPLKTISIFREKWNISRPFVALYSGNIANKQGIELIVEAAHLLAHHTDIAFVVCGEGPQKDALIASAAKLDNISFHELQPAELLNELLGLADVHLLPQLAGTSELLLPSKLTNMLASGRPIVATADQETALSIELQGCGLITPPGDAAAFAHAIKQLANDREFCLTMEKSARKNAEWRWSKQVILSQLIQIIRDRFSELPMKRPIA